MTDNTLRDYLTQIQENNPFLNSNGLPINSGNSAGQAPFYVDSTGHLNFGYGYDLQAHSSADLNDLLSDTSLSSGDRTALKTELDNYISNTITLSQLNSNIAQIDWRPIATQVMDGYYTNTVSNNLSNDLVNVVGLTFNELAAVQANTQVWAALQDLVYNANGAIHNSTILGLNDAIKTAASSGNWGEVAFDIMNNPATKVPNRRAAEAEVILGFDFQTGSPLASVVPFTLLPLPDSQTVATFLNDVSILSCTNTQAKENVLDILASYYFNQAQYSFLSGLPIYGPPVPSGLQTASIAPDVVTVSPHYEPLVFNLSGTGLAATTTLNDGVFFDNDNNGFAELTAWTGANSGILVHDGSDDPITNGSQMFGTATSLIGGGYAVDGFDALADLDSNSDGVINSSDTAWSDLRMWVDSNGNGITDSGELLTLSTAGITSISLTTTNANVTDANGNYHGLKASYSKAGGGTGEVDDVSFVINPTLSTPVNRVDITDTDIAALPDLSGYGVVTSLQQAMQIQENGSDITLKGYVEDFVAATSDATRNTLVDEIIFQWTDTTGVSTSSRGSYVNGRQLAALEAFNGQPFVGSGGSNPTSSEAKALSAGYQQLHDYILAGLEAQTDLKVLFDGIALSYDLESNQTSYDFTATETQLLSDLSADRVNGLVELSDFNQALHALGMDTDAGFAAFRDDLISQGADVAATFSGGESVINGTAGNDVIIAWGSNQTILAGQGGNDTLIGGGDNQTFYGSTGSNLFIGGDGDNEVFWGGNNNYAPSGGVPGTSDTFIAGHGTEIFRESGLGSATIIYAAGCGDLTILNYGVLNNQSVIKLDSSIDRADISIAVSGDTQTITDGVSGDQITVQKRSVQSLIFADGVTINLRDTDGTHLATSGATLSGGMRDDIYSYNSGTGHATLTDTGGTNVLWLGAGLSSGSISLTASGDDLLITDGVSGDQITDKNRSVQTLLFADGSTLNLFVVGSTYTLSGASLSATGTALNDTYSYASGAGSASISDPGGSNTLALSGGIVSGDLVFTGSGTDLLIADGVSGDQVLIAGQLSGRAVVGTAVFSGGGSVALSGLLLHEASGQTVLNGTTGGDTLLGNAGSQTLNGNGGNDIFVAGAGHTTANGGTGNDTYSFASGNGTLTINDASGLNRIAFGSGIDAGDVSWSGSGSDLLITDGVSGDLIVVKGQLGPQFVMDSIVFDDDSTLALEGIAIARLCAAVAAHERVAAISGVRF